MITEKERKKKKKKVSNKFVVVNTLSYHLKKM